MRRILACIAVTAIVATGSGCGSSQDKAPTPTSTTPSPSATPVDAIAVLSSMMDKLKTTTAHLRGLVMTATSAVKTEADIDSVAKKSHVTTTNLTTGQRTEVLVIGSGVYLRTAKTPTGPWLHVELGKLRKNSPLRSLASATDSLGILGGLLTASETNYQRFHGNADLHKAAANATNVALHDSLESLATLIGTTSTAVPFDVVVDEQGRLKTLTYETPTDRGLTVKAELQVYDYDKPVTIEAPAVKDIKEATSSAYATL